MGESDFTEVLSSINQLNESAGLPPFQIKAIPQGAATSVWAAVVAESTEIGGRYCEDCHVAEINDGPGFEGVKSYAVDADRAELLWKESEKLIANLGG